MTKYERLMIAVAAVVVPVLIVNSWKEEAQKRHLDPWTLQPKRDAGASTQKTFAGFSPAGVAAPPAPPHPAKISPDVRDLYEQRPLATAYERLSNAAVLTAEDRYLLAEITTRCSAWRQGRENRAKNRTLMSRDEARARFAAAIPAKDPNRDARLRAFERMSIDPCEGVDIKPGIDAKQLMEEAAAGGDPKARIARLARQMGERSQKDNFRTQLLDADIAELKSIIASDDILAIRRAWSTLNQPYYENASLRFGPDQAEIDNRAFDAALSLLMCDMGTDCSRSSFLLATVCLAGQCAAHDMREYLFTYQLSAMSAQLVDEYLAGLRRVRAGDWSSFTVYPGPTSTFVAVRAR